MVERLVASPEGIATAVALIREGALVAFPTDTVYGIGSRAGDAAVLERIFEAKRRPVEKRIPILAASLEQVSELGYAADERARVLADRFWPGALTIVLRAVFPGAPGAPGTMVREPTQAFRVPDHPVALALIRAAGPLAVTSANRSGEPETYEADDVLVAFADTDLLAVVVDGGRVPGGVASTVVDCSGPRPRLVREGPIARAELEEVAGPID
jgi:L-threonylcarbamoyladenylate synthase